MALPKPALPIFSLTVPSTGEKVTFRQFTVREEKMLAQAQQSEDVGTIVNAIKCIIDECVTGLKDPSSLALFDLEYIITKIRAKSVGETIDMQMPCEADATHRPIPVRVELDKIEVITPPGHSKNIKLYDGVGIVMKYPSLSMLTEFEQMTDPFEAVIMCIDHIYTEEEIFYAHEQTKEELQEFLEGLTSTQFKLIETTFLETMPKFEYNLDYTCPECGHEHHKVIKGMSNFFV